MKQHLAFFVTGHGFGHATRACALIDRLPAEVQVTLYTPAPEWLFSLSLLRPFRYVFCDIDVGTVQHDALTSDAGQTLRRFSELWADRHRLAGQWADVLREAGTTAALIDIAPIAMEAAFAAGIPSAAITNFTWDWIYRPFIEERPEYAHLLPEIELAHRRTEALFCLPLHGEMRGFRRIIPTGHLVRPPRHASAETRARLGMNGNRTHVLVSFGGFGERRFPMDALAELSGFSFHLMQSLEGSLPGNFTVHEGTDLFHPDLVHAADVVLGKLGYGLVSECLSAGTPMVYVPRAGFPEHDVFVDELPAQLPVFPLAVEDFLSGRWQPALHAAAEADAEPAENIHGASEILAWLPRLFSGWAS